MRLGTAILVLLAVAGASADTLEVPSKAYPTIQSAIAAATAGDLVLVAPGTYEEDILFFGQPITVRSSDGASVTTIKGLGTRSVVRFMAEEPPDTVLAGFTITGGIGTWIVDPVFGDVRAGGGIYVENASPTIRNCILTNNSPWGGGAACNFGASPTYEGCTFIHNEVEGHGGGMYNLLGSSPVVTGCDFLDNIASWGGGMTNTDDSHPVVTECRFENNLVENVGGGMYNRSSSHPTVTTCIFSGNHQAGNPYGYGGGMCNYGGGKTGGPSNPVVTDCTFEGNSVTGDGGGMMSSYGCEPIVSGCTFQDNHAGRYGGGMRVNQAAPTIIDCVLRNNLADVRGGGLDCEGSAATWLTDSLLCGNAPDQLWGEHVDGGGNTIAETCGPYCPADINDDGTIDVTDILAVIAAWGSCTDTTCPEDVDGSGTVDVTDILLVIAGWGPC